MQGQDEDEQLLKTLPLKTTPSLNHKMSFSFGISEVKAIDKTPLGLRNKFNISPSRAFAIGRLDQPQSSIKRRHQSVTQAPTESPHTLHQRKLASIAEEMDTRTAQQTTFTSKLNRELVGGGPVYQSSQASGKIQQTDINVTSYRRNFKKQLKKNWRKVFLH